MTHFTKIDDVTNAVNTTPTHAATPTVREAATHPNRQSVGEKGGPRIPSADLHARRIAREAGAWIELARERTWMAEPTLTAKALQATAFSVQHRANSFAVPSKLVGTAKHQRALWALVSESPAPWTKLTATVQTGGGITVSLGSQVLGEIQAKHVPWARPLVPFGLAVHLGRVTGHEREGYRLGCNVVFAHVGAAVAGLRAALDAEAGASGDGAGGRVPTSRIVVSPTASALGGDGAPGSADDLSTDDLPAPVPTVPILPGREALSGEPDDVYLWRDAEGLAHASVPHVVRHSPTGLEFGYLGSGPADLALSVLTALVDRETASALYQRFKAEVVARVPDDGGVLRAADVRAWAEAARRDPTTG